MPQRRGIHEWEMARMVDWIVGIDVRHNVTETGEVVCRVAAQVSTAFHRNASVSDVEAKIIDD